MNNKKYQVIALMGKSGAGKDTMLNVTTQLHSDIFHPIINCTTRPIRSNEINGVNYHFISVAEFTLKVLDGSMLEATEFRDWFYGTPIDSLVEDKINIGVFNPTAIEALVEDPRLNVLIVEIACTDKLRLQRSLEREENPDCHEICRRFFADETDFANFELEPDIIVESTTGSSADLLEHPEFNLEWLKVMQNAISSQVKDEKA